MVWNPKSVWKVSRLKNKHDEGREVSCHSAYHSSSCWCLQSSAEGQIQPPLLHQCLQPRTIPATILSSWWNVELVSQGGSNGHSSLAPPVSREPRVCMMLLGLEAFGCLHVLRLKGGKHDFLTSLIPSNPLHSPVFSLHFVFPT